MRRAVDKGFDTIKYKKKISEYANGRLKTTTYQKTMAKTTGRGKRRASEEDDDDTPDDGNEVLDPQLPGEVRNQRPSLCNRPLTNFQTIRGVIRKLRRHLLPLLVGTVNCTMMMDRHCTTTTATHLLPNPFSPEQQLCRMVRS